ncbi:ubiquitin thioesterase OTU1-like [Macrosteles quadrilineatus]|uniref:ubiquitin thioesterase OTU1-like n=1 Tax=Macrosteles quadrilineatus TaxID=74068 RepID=UPI0023E2BDA3|nr:ubiquitin thioesterase OTU1-like [Macrosteles quadrilineatus]XP_054280299.1 ubiquitin thioesterase OTU1-like [Macrosteles quadrilineatus]
MASLLLKVKTKQGQEVLKSISSSSSITFLKEELSRVANIPTKSLHVLSGFPPKQVDLSDEAKTVESIGINSGDILIVEEKPTSRPMEKEEKKTWDDSEARRHISESQMNSPGILLKKVVPADNSCLFTSIGFVLSGKIDTNCGSHMREIIAEAVSTDTDTYNEAILGRPSNDYCSWIKRSESWGGAIELAILSKFYGIEIAVVDTVNAIINRFGEDQLYDHRVFLIFDGIHYDPLYLEPFEGDNKIQTMFPTADDKVLREAEVLAMEAKKSHQFTDVNRFTLQCLDCKVFLIGQKEALGHAKETGHSNFGEVHSS